jgi:hypothetical protein
MAIEAITIVFGLLGLFGGGTIGALARQPEINKLKEQVKTLQKEVKRLNSLIDEQNRQINALRGKYEALKGKQIIEAAKAQGHLKGAIMYSYCLKEYLDMNYRIVKAKPNDSNENQNPCLSKKEYAFYEGFGKVLRGDCLTEKDNKLLQVFLRNFIREKYANEIDGLIPCELKNTLRRIEEL